MPILFSDVTVVPMDGAPQVLEHAYVAVEGTKIASVGTEPPEGTFDRVVDGHRITDFGAQRPQGFTGKCIDGKGGILMPGLVNAHTHVPMTLMRGYGGGCDLHTWLNQYIFPAEARLDSRAVAAGAGLGLAEMIASGVTTIADMYGHTDAVAQEVAASGISANLSVGGVQFTDDFNPDTHNDCRVQRELTEQWHGYNDGQILVDASIHAEYTSSPPLWQWMADFARDYGLRMHAHISETASEHQGSLERLGLTPIQALDRCGVWENGGIAAHCVYTTAEDWAIMAAKDVSCVHNPWSNLKLGSGVAPIPDMLRAGVNIALGTDGMSSHNSADFFSDLKLAACLHKGIRRDPTAVTARQALYMATAGGALALGRRDTGRIVPGYRADLILVDFEAANLVPCHDIAENLVFAAHGANVVMNMARGKVIYEDGAFLTLDLDAIKSEVRRYALPLVFGGSPTT